MPGVLTDERFCDPFVPAAWEGVLADVAAFLEAEEAARKQLTENDGGHDPPEALLALHDRIVRDSSALLEPAVLADCSAESLQRLFARSVLLLMRLKECVATGEGVFDTAGSRTLALYEADFYNDPLRVQALRERLLRATGLTAAELAALEAEVERDLEVARRRQRVVRALRQEFGLYADAADVHAGAYRLFRFVYPEAPLCAEDVELVVTGTLVFFCLPMQGTTLTTPGFAARTEPQRQAVQDFLRALQRFTQARFARFPAFGYVSPEGLDAAVLARLAQRCGQSPAEVAAELACAITVLPLAEIDKYLIHDVWGHGWQASLLRFDRNYAEMATYDRQLDLAESADSPRGAGAVFASSFPIAEGRAAFDAAAFERFVQGEISERLPIAMTGALAEVMADVAEYKFVATHPGQAEWLPSSSFFKRLPAKLDLTLQDVTFYFSQATKTFRLWAQQPERQERTVAGLIARGADAASARAAVAEAVAAWQRLAQGMYRPRLAWRPAGSDRLEVTAVARVMLNFVGLHRAVLETYHVLEGLSTTGLPLKSYRDLFVLGAAAFFEADPARNLWRMDEYLSLSFVPLCRRLSEG